MKILLPAACCLLLPPLALAQEGNEGYVVMTPEEAHAAGLVDEIVPGLSLSLDELRELGSKEAVLKRIAEHHENWGATVALPPGSDVERLLDALGSGDDRLQEVLSAIAGREVKLPPSHGDGHPLHHGEKGVFYDMPERYTNDEILARMRPEHVEALAKHRHLLDDRWKLIDSLDYLEGLEHSAVREFLTKMTKSEPPRMSPEMTEEARQAEGRGWYELDTPAPGSQILRELTRLTTTAAGEEHFAGSSLSASGAYAEYIPETVASYSFDGGSYGSRLDVVSDTKYGGVLYAKKNQFDHVAMVDPNLHVFPGYDAKVSTTKHADGVWVTAVSAFDGWYRYEVGVEKKLEGEERDEFVRMAIAMIVEDLSK